MKPMLIAAALAASLTFGALAPARVAAQPVTGPVEIVVWNIHHGGGHLRVAICDKATFADVRRDCPYRADAPATEGVTTVVVPDVPAGVYAAQVFQDVHDQHAVPRSALGLPLVGVGFSRDAPIRLSPPKFKDAAFSHDPGALLTLRIMLRYFPHL